MILEYAQMLSTAHHVLDGDDVSSILYKKTHVNHPSSVWVRNSLQHYQWLYDLWLCLCGEYTNRYSKIHLTEQKLRQVLKTPPHNIANIGFIAPPLAMPDKYKSDCTVTSYRNYYRGDKAAIATYKFQNFPKWMVDISSKNALNSSSPEEFLA